MAKVTVKLFGVYRVDTGIKQLDLECDTLKDVFTCLHEKLGNVQMDSGLQFKDAVVYVGGEACRKKSRKLKDGDEIWLLSPASGG